MTPNISPAQQRGAPDAWKRIIGAVIAFSAVFGASMIAVTAIVPVSIAAYLVHAGLLSTFVFALGAMNYERNSIRRSQGLIVGLGITLATSSAYDKAQGLLHPDVAKPASYLSPDVVVPVIVITGLALASLIIVRRVVWHGFRFHL